MGSAPGEDHRVVAHPNQPLVVIPAPPQVVAAEVVTRVGDPRGRQLAVGPRREVDKGHLPVGLVIVDAVERRAVVVEVEEEAVLQGDPSAAPDDPAVVDVPLIRGEGLAVCPRRGRHDGSRRVAADEQAEREDGIDQAGHVADPRQAARSAVEALGLGQILRGSAEQGTRLRRKVDVLDTPEELDRAELGRAWLGQVVDREVPGGHEELVPAGAGAVRPERAPSDVRIDVGGEEELALGVMDDRFVAAQERHVRFPVAGGLRLDRGRTRLGCGGVRGHGGVAHAVASSSPKASRTSAWFMRRTTATAKVMRT